MKMRIMVILLAILAMPVSAAQFGSSTDSIDGGAIAGDTMAGCVPMPPVCTGNKALQWDGSNWQCNATSARAVG